MSESVFSLSLDSTFPLKGGNFISSESVASPLDSGDIGDKAIADSNDKVVGKAFNISVAAEGS